jgi:hypothetical protein
MLKNWLATLRREEDGAVTVDWVVLTAALVGIGISIVTTTGSGSTDLTDKMTDDMSTLADKYY